MMCESPVGVRLYFARGVMHWAVPPSLDAEIDFRIMSDAH